MSTKSVNKKLIHKKTKTIWVGIFCLAVLVYLCLVARVHIQQFKSTYVQQVQQQLLQQACAQRKHLEDAVDILHLKLQEFASHKIEINGLENDSVFYRRYFSVVPQGLFFVDNDGDVQTSFMPDTTGRMDGVKEIISGVMSQISDEKSDKLAFIDAPSRSLYVLSATSEGDDFQGDAVVSIGLSELISSINQTATFSGYGICLIDPQGQLICLKENELGHLLKEEYLSQDENSPSSRVFSKMLRGQQGVSKLSQKALNQSDSKSFSEEILIGYCPLSLCNQHFSIAIISDDSLITAAVQAHIQGIMVAMVCLFAVLMIVCMVYYKSEKQRLLLEQQSELGQTTKELHQVTVEKRQIVEKLQNKLRFYRQILNTLPIGLYWRDHKGVLKDQNAAFRKIFDHDDRSEPDRNYISKQDQIDHEVLTKGIELLNIPETIDVDGQEQQFLVSRIPVSSKHFEANGMISCYLPKGLFDNLSFERSCSSKDLCLTQGLSLPVVFVDNDFVVRGANPAFYNLVQKDSEQESSFGLAECIESEVNAPVVETMKQFINDKHEEIRQFQIKYNSKNYQVWAQLVDSMNNPGNPGAVLLWIDQSQGLESSQILEFELYRYRSEINEQEMKIRKYEECLPERLERLFRDKVKRAEEILAMKDEDPMTPIRVQQLIESVQKSLNCCQGKDNEAKIEFAPSNQLSEEIFSEWHKLYQSLVILGETLSEQTSEPVRFHVQNQSEANWIGGEQGRPNDVIFSVEYNGPLLLEALLPQILDVEISLTQWYNQCSQRDQAVNLRVAARLLSKIECQLKASCSDGLSRFWFVLAEYEKQVEPSKMSAHEPSEQQAGSGELKENQSSQSDIPHILVVDDVDENRTLMQILLAKDGHRSTVCQSGEQAVEICRQERFDLILMDIQMPGMNGLEATKQIRDMGMNVSTPIIAMTASDEQDDELAALDCGCDDYLTKPIKRKLMERKIWRSLEKTRQIKDAEAGKDIISFLDGNGDYQKAIEAFVENLPQRVEEMKLAFQQDDMKDLAFKVHALKGLGGFAGFAIYTEKARQIEESIKEKDVKKVQAQLDEMIQMCMRTKLKTDC